MNKSNFNAYSWFNSNEAAPANANNTMFDDRIFHQSLVDFTQAESPTSSLNKFFVPGWRGESLASKEVKSFNLTLKKIHQDVKEKFLSIEHLNSRLKKSIYDEFLCFAEFMALNFTGIDTAQDFFRELSDSESVFRSDLDRFINIYTFRTSVIFTLKIRFISVLTNETKLEFQEKNIFYPNSFLTKIFRKGSSTELNSVALKQNLYSWYRPDPSLKASLISFYKNSDSLAITDIIKNISILSEENLSHKAEYSHSISHKQFGLYLNSLLINFPLWLKKFNPRFKSSFKADELEIISSKYDGDYLESMALSHWLGQDTNKSMKWEQILCPIFHSDTFDKGLFTKVINELQFLTFLSQIASKQNKEPIKFICDVTKGHLENRKETAHQQKNLFNDISTNKSTYDRLILNLTEYPKSNVQHYILNTVSKNINTIKENGLIYVISPKKVFIPSQKAKIENFLKKFTLEAQFDFSNIEGKGEIGNYIYIFSKNTKHRNTNLKNSFLNFRLGGKLNTFQEFENVTKLTHDFFMSNLKDIPSIAAKSSKGLSLEFFQDAIVSGQMIHASSQDSNKITHPQFFNNLTKSCTTFNNFFEVKPIKDEQHFHEFSSLGLNQDKSFSDNILIVDLRSKEDTKIEIIKNNALESKIENYGKSMCFYFELTPKCPSLDIESVKAFLKSPIGKQIIDLTFNNQLIRAKANLNKLLLPKFLVQQKSIPGHISPALEALEISTAQILETHPRELKSKFNEISGMLKDLTKEYPTEVIARVSEFKKNIDLSLELFDSNHKRNAYNFNNPMLKTPLLLAKTSAIYPQNEDIFLEFTNVASAKVIHYPMTHFKSLTKKNDGHQTYQIDLYSNELKVISLYSDQEMVKFLEFLLSNVEGVSISQIIQGIKVPELENLKSIIDSFDQMKNVLIELSEELSPLVDKLFTLSINKN